MNNSILTLDRVDATTAILTLNRPDRRNALSMELMESLCVAVESLASAPQRRVVILRGSGPVFCAGLDLVEAAELDAFERSADWVARTFQTLASTALLTIAAAHGGAYAGGVGLMACCDFVMAADDLRVGLPEVRRGLVPALVTAVLRGRLRLSDLRQMAILGEPIDAHQALGIGLVDRVVPAHELMTEAQGLAATVLKGAPDAVRQTKRLLCELPWGDLAQRFARALEYHKQARRSDEAREGLAAFRERREPRWSVE